MANKEETFVTEYVDRKLADILFNFLKYTKDYVIKKELEKQSNKYISHRNIIDILEEDTNENDLQEGSFTPVGENHDIAINFIEKLGFNVKDLLHFYNLKLDRAGIYFIYSKNYNDNAFILKQIELFENVVNSMNEKNIMFNYKNNLILFINTLKLNLGN